MRQVFGIYFLGLPVLGMGAVWVLRDAVRLSMGQGLAGVRSSGFTVPQSEETKVPVKVLLISMLMGLPCMEPVMAV
jgi:hypothetical protein